MSSNLTYPEIGAYALPEKNILVLSCIDLRLTDNLLNFLHFDNLSNRYDHFALAGTSLLTQLDHPQLGNLFDPEKLKILSNPTHWKSVWKDHLSLAIALHGIKDVYIIEHQNCGAYQNLLKDETSAIEEKECHQLYATALAQEIANDDHLHLKAHCFYIDLRGNVFHLGSFPQQKQ